MIDIIIRFLSPDFRKRSDMQENMYNLYLQNVVINFNLKYFYYNSIDIPMFIREEDLINKPYLPTYIMYLIKEKDFDRLRKILIIDYKVYPPSSIPRIRSIMNNIVLFPFLILIFAIIFGYMASIILFLGSSFKFFWFLFGYLTQPEVVFPEIYPRLLVGSLIYMLIYEFKLRHVLSKILPDYSNESIIPYSQDINVIEKIIKDKEKEYDDNHKNFFYYKCNCKCDCFKRL